MQPQRNSNATLVDLLDRVLDKGLVIHADVIVSVAGIPLIGVNLRAALAGMETMLKYGIMQAWDERTRAWEKDYRDKKKTALLQGEEIILKMLGAYYSSDGIHTAWKYGYLYVTNERLLLYHEDFGEVLFEVPLATIVGLAIKKGDHFADEEGREELYLVLKGNSVARLTATDVDQLEREIEKGIKGLGLVVDDPPLAVFKGNGAGFLAVGERVICRGKTWFLTGAEGIMGNTWRPGHLYLTDRRLCWYYDLEKRPVLDLPIEQLTASAMETREAGGALKNKKVLDVVYAADRTRKVATFSGGALAEWDRVLKSVIAGRGVPPAGDEIETCPQCGRSGPIKDLLEEGCTRCGWVSPKIVVSD